MLKLFRSFPDLLTVEPVPDCDDGVAGGHGLHHPAGRDVAEEGQEEEKDRGGCPASHGEGCGKCEGSGPYNQSGALVIRDEVRDHDVARPALLCHRL